MQCRSHLLRDHSFFRACGATFDTAFSLSGSFIAALSLAALSLAVLRLATSNLAAMRDYERQDLRRPVKFLDWGEDCHGFCSDTVKDQAPVIFRVRDVPGAPHDQKGWVLLVLQIDNDKNCNVDRRGSSEPSSICFLFLGMVFGIGIICFIIAVIALMIGFQLS